MSKSTAATVSKFDAKAAVREMSLAVKANDKSGKRLIDAVLAFRKSGADEKTVKVWITDAYTGAGYDEKSKTLASRRSEALVLFRAPTVPAVLPRTLQAAAALVRGLDDYKAASQAAGRKGAKAGTKAPKAGGMAPAQAPASDAPSASVKPMDVDAIRAELLAHVNQLKARAADDVAASLLAELVDVLS